MTKAPFNEAQTLHRLKHYLPSQTPLKDFIHHNSLHAFQALPFYEAIFKSAHLFGHQVTLSLANFRQLYVTGRIRRDVLEAQIKARKGAAEQAQWLDKLLHAHYDTPPKPCIGQIRAYWQTVYGIDLDNLVQPLLFRMLCSYLDQGIAIDAFPYPEEGFLEALRHIESHSYSSFFKTATARNLLFDSSQTIERLLDRLVGDSRHYETYLFDQQFGHRGWSGLVAAIEAQPDTLLYHKSIQLKELIVLDLILEIDALEAHIGTWLPLAQAATLPEIDLFNTPQRTEREEVLSIWQDAFEWSYYDQVFAGLKQLKDKKTAETPVSKSFQAIFCIDEREDSLRRHIESVDPLCETLGCPGFFGVAFYYQKQGSQFLEKLCPAPVTPQHLIKESGAAPRLLRDVLYDKQTHTALRGFFSALILGFWAAIRLVRSLVMPKRTPAAANAFAHMSLNGQLSIENTDINHREQNLQVGFTVEEMANSVYNLLNSIGLIQDFASFVYVVGHGASSANNPHHGAYDCGACSGRPGATNARVFAFMANHAGVRALLAERGLHIPAETVFVAALHDTSADVMAYYDVDALPASRQAAHLVNSHAFEAALDLNAKERSRRFASINTKADIATIRAAIQRRSVSVFEPRPELGHGTNALCFVGHRSRTKGLFLDRRAFMNSYDWRTDPTGKRLLDVMRPLPPVCGGINLEYYFSRVDNQRLGCGPKLSHNIMGLVGVANSCDGDLRPGLPWQMVEPHDPVRLMIVVEHYPDIVLKTIQADARLYEWFINDWVHLTAIHPETDALYVFQNGHFQLYTPLAQAVKTAPNIHHLLENAVEMSSNDISEATKENLDVHILL